MRRCVTIHPFLLHFSESFVERKYVEWRVRSMFLAVDRKFAWLNICLFIFFGITELRKDSPPLGMLLLLVSLTGYCIQLMVMHLNNGQFWTQQRPWIIAIVRFYRVLVSVFAVPLWIRQQAHDWPTLIRSLILGSGSMINAWLAFGMPVIFSTHLLLQAPLALVMMVFTGWKQCESFIQNEQAAIRITKLAQQMDFVLGWFSEPKSLMALEGFDSINDSFVDCRRLVTLSYLVMSLMIPSFVLWLLEIHSRVAFIKTVRHSRDEAFRGIAVDATWIPDGPKVLVLLTTSIFTLWLVF